MTYTIYHNPKCSKCRGTLEILNSKGVEPKIIEYLKNPPTKDDLKEIINKLNIRPSELVRFKEGKAIELGISAEDNLMPSLAMREKSLNSKSKEFHKIIKVGRTHLQDATPIRLGQEFSGYASMIKNDSIAIGIKTYIMKGENLYYGT